MLDSYGIANSPDDGWRYTIDRDITRTLASMGCIWCGRFRSCDIKQRKSGGTDRAVVQTNGIGNDTTLIMHDLLDKSL